MSRIRSQKGVALLVSLGVMLTMIGLCLGLFYIGLADSKQATVNRGLIRATAYAEGATEVGHKALINAVAQCAPAPTGGTTTIGGVPMTYTITKTGPMRSCVNANNLAESGQLYTIAATGEWNGMFKRVEKVVDVTAVPMFQFAIFYNGDLEIQPGPNLTINGKVHTNGNMYLGADSVLKLNTNYVRAAGHIYRRSLATNLPTTGEVDILINGTTNKFAKMLSQKQFSVASVSGFDSSFLGLDANKDGDYSDKSDAAPWTQGSLDLWNGTVKSIEHGYQPITPPTRDLIEPYIASSGGDYTYNSVTGQYVKVAPGTGDYRMGSLRANAGITVIDGKVCDASGIEITDWTPGPTENPADNPISTSSIYDAREQKYITVTNIDLALLNKAGYWPSNGLLYAMRTDTTVAQANGIRLKNGALFPAPLTVASPDPVYVWGDYNAGNKTYPKQPASIMTDAIDILSNSWDDTKSPGKLPHANPTIINAAIMTGACPTTAGSYNGGFENLPRFHEKWDGSPATITGSFFYVWDSKYAEGKWAYGGDRYIALSRDWNYDTMFDDPTKMPPFTPSVYYTRQVAWITR